MGRGDRPASSGDVPRNVKAPPRHRLVLADEAIDEWNELVTYIRKDSPKNAAAMYDAISRRLFQLSMNPKLGHADPNAPPVPTGATALLTTVKKVAIYYLFPLPHRGNEIIYVLSIRRGSRQPLEQPEYARRWIEEVSKISPPEEGPEEG